MGMRVLSTLVPLFGECSLGGQRIPRQRRNSDNHTENFNLSDLGEQGQALRDDCSQFKACMKVEGPRTIALCQAHDLPLGPICRDRFSRNVSTAGATLGLDAQSNSGDPDSAPGEGMASRRVGFLRCQLVASLER